MRKHEDPCRDPASEARDDWEEREEGIRFSSVNRELAAKVGRLEHELEQERQDRKQADIDTIRALGERNDARKLEADWRMLADLAEQKLQQERQLADRLADCLETVLSGYDDAKEIAPINGHEAWESTQALAAWKAARNEAVNPP